MSTTDKSMVTSLIMVDNIQHAPIKKLTTELQERQMQKTVIDSAINAIKYPSGVFQLNGYLKNQRCNFYLNGNSVLFYYCYIFYILKLQKKWKYLELDRFETVWANILLQNIFNSCSIWEKTTNWPTVRTRLLKVG